MFEIEALNHRLGTVVEQEFIPCPALTLKYYWNRSEVLRAEANQLLHKARK